MIYNYLESRNATSLVKDKKNTSDFQKVNLLLKENH